MLWKYLMRMTAALVGAWLAMLIALPFFARWRDNQHRPPSCQSSLKQIGLGLLQYAQDYHAYPRNDVTAATGWASFQLYPYMRDLEIFSCPQDGTARKRGLFCYGLNANLAGKSTTRVRKPPITVLNYEVTAKSDGSQACGVHKPVHTGAWIRHSGAANYGFAHGHVELLTPDKIGSSVKAFYGTFDVDK